MKKLNNISLLRLLACVGVFCFHYLSILTTFDTKVYMPSPFFVFIFAFVSAFLYSKKSIEDPKKWIVKNLLKLLVPVIVFVLTASLLLIVVGLIRYQGSFEETFKGFAGKNPSDGQPNFVFGNLWFLGILAICYLFTPLLSKIANKNFSKKGYFALAIISVVIVCLAETLFNFFCPVFTVYVISYFLGRLFYDEVLNKKNILVPIISLLLTGASASMWYIFVGKIDYQYSDMHIRVLRHVLEFFVAIPFSFFFLYVMRFTNKFNLGFLKYTDKYSFPFYMTHQLFLVGTLSFFELIPSWYFVPVIALSIINSILIVLLSDQVFVLISYVKNRKKDEPQQVNQ